jgi:hypothetical protein
MEDRGLQSAGISFVNQQLAISDWQLAFDIARRYSLRVLLFAGVPIPSLPPGETG